MLPDLHSHTTFSDGRSSHREMVTSALDKGISVFGITDHICFHDNSWTTPRERLPELPPLFEKLKKEFSNLKLLYGMEVDYVPGCENEVALLKKIYNWDYIIGSVHYVGSWNIDDNAEDWQGKDVDATWAEYLSLVENMVDSKLYNIVGHIDIPKKFNFYSSQDISSRYKAIGEKIKTNGMAYEINTAGRIKPCNEFYPNESIVHLLYSMGVDVTLGSDAHHKDNVAQYFTEAVAMLKRVGYSSICYFEKGEKYRIDI